MSTLHPCLRCGACCAAYRVTLHWLETESDDTGVPVELTEPLDRHRLVMAGTRSFPVRCTALVGIIGGPVHCGIYARRPGVCRALDAAFEHGEPSPQCDRARQRHGLAPLVAADWAGRDLSR